MSSAPATSWIRTPSSLAELDGLYLELICVAVNLPGTLGDWVEAFATFVHPRAQVEDTPIISPVPIL